ncbi:Tll0287-like domain-containing protein [Penaeicola halotolerans]|uniref:Tll0287-like domain-containing protein n=1 Tax=Penaeicola halotolerans TaxID=2793196 RepID=UPI001CF89846|nr:DUF3365 domain-containing protein [Penaeicola halotolerans]
MKKQILGTILSLTLVGCGAGTERAIDRESLQEGMKKQEVKVLREADILQAAMEWGDEISQEAQKALLTTLQEAIASRGTVGAVEYCNVAALPLMDSLSNAYGVTVRRVSHKLRNPADAPLIEMEEILLEAYVYNEENGLKSESNLQKIDGGETLLYTKPITIGSGLCLSCHGKDEISTETLQKINELYPNDNATGHELNSLRGMWSIKLPKSAVINAKF